MDLELVRVLGPIAAIVVVGVLLAYVWDKTHRPLKVDLTLTLKQAWTSRGSVIMASKPPGDFNDGQTDHCWDAAGKWYLCSQWTDQGGGVQVWRYDGEGKGEQDTGWTRVLHVPNPEGYYCHGFAFALHVGKMKVCYRGQDKQTIVGDDIPGFALFAPLSKA